MTDEQWTALEPLIEDARPRGRRRPQDLRRTIEAIIWRHANGAKWRAMPAALGPWWRAAQLFIRWGQLGAWERLFQLAQAWGVELGMVFLDGSIRAHHKAAGARKKGGSSASRDRREALGRSRGSFGTKACIIADGQAGRSPSP